MKLEEQRYLNYYLIHKDSLPKLVTYQFVTKKRLDEIIEKLEKGTINKSYSCYSKIPANFLSEECTELRMLCLHLKKTKHKNYYLVHGASCLKELIAREINLIPAGNGYIFLQRFIELDLQEIIQKLENVFNCKIPIQEVIKHLKKRKTFRFPIDEEIEMRLEIFIHSATEKGYIPSLTIEFDNNMTKIKRRSGVSDASRPGFKIILKPKEGNDFFFGEKQEKVEKYANKIRTEFNIPF